MNQITVEELHQMVEDHLHPHVLDVREEAEYEESNIGARLFPLSRLHLMEADEIEDWRDQEIIVHCHSGKRSLQACQLLETMGFPKITNLIGGIEAWHEKYGQEKIE